MIPARTRHIITGFVKDKDIPEALRLFPKNALFYFTNAQIPRALPAYDLQCMAAEAGMIGPAYKSVAEALDSALNNAKTDDAILITGSFFIVGDVLSYFENGS